MDSQILDLLSSEISFYVLHISTFRDIISHPLENKLKKWRACAIGSTYSLGSLYRIKTMATSQTSS